MISRKELMVILKAIISLRKMFIWQLRPRGWGGIGVDGGGGLGVVVYGDSWWVAVVVIGLRWGVDWYIGMVK